MSGSGCSRYVHFLALSKIVSCHTSLVTHQQVVHGLLCFTHAIRVERALIFAYSGGAARILFLPRKALCYRRPLGRGRVLQPLFVGVLKHPHFSGLVDYGSSAYELFRLDRPDPQWNGRCACCTAIRNTYFRWRMYKCRRNDHEVTPPPIFPQI